MNRFVTFVAFAFAVAACNRGLHYSPLSTPSGLKPKPPESVKIAFEGQQPQCPNGFTTVGLFEYSAGNVFHTEAESVRAIQEGAGARGFDGVYALHCAPPGTVNADIHECSGKGYVCTSQ